MESIIVQRVDILQKFMSIVCLSLEQQLSRNKF
jgi:hypothetical protein